MSFLVTDKQMPHERYFKDGSLAVILGLYSKRCLARDGKGCQSLRQQYREAMAKNGRQHHGRNEPGARLEKASGIFRKGFAFLPAA